MKEFIHFWLNLRHLTSCGYYIGRVKTLSLLFNFLLSFSLISWLIHVCRRECRSLQCKYCFSIKLSKTLFFILQDGWFSDNYQEGRASHAWARRKHSIIEVCVSRSTLQLKKSRCTVEANMFFMIFLSKSTYLCTQPEHLHHNLSGPTSRTWHHTAPCLLVPSALLVQAVPEYQVFHLDQCLLQHFRLILFMFSSRKLVVIVTKKKMVRPLKVLRVIQLAINLPIAEEDAW